jgi:hypothetical protein
MNKGILNIKLTKRPSSSDSQLEQKTNSGGLDHRTEGVLIIKAITLFESFSNQPSLVYFNRAIGMFLDFENTHGINDTDASLGRNQTSCLILEKSLIFLFH